MTIKTYLLIAITASQMLFGQLVYAGVDLPVFNIENRTEYDVEISWQTTCTGASTATSSQSGSVGSGATGTFNFDCGVDTSNLSPQCLSGSQACDMGITFVPTITINGTSCTITDWSSGESLNANFSTSRPGINYQPPKWGPVEPCETSNACVATFHNAGIGNNPQNTNKRNGVSGGIWLQIKKTDMCTGNVDINICDTDDCEPLANQ